MEINNTEQPAGVIPTPSYPQQLSPNSAPPEPMNAPVPKPPRRGWLGILLIVIVALALIGTNAYTYQQLRQAKLELKNVTDENKKLTIEIGRYKEFLELDGKDISDSPQKSKEKSENEVTKNNARTVDTGLAQYYLDNDNTYPVFSQKTGANVEELVNPLSDYIVSSSVYQHQQQALYVSSNDGKYYVQARCLTGEYDTPLSDAFSDGNGVYKVTNGSITLSTVAGLNLGSIGSALDLGLTFKQAFVTYGPQ